MELANGALIIGNSGTNSFDYPDERAIRAAKWEADRLRMAVRWYWIRLVLFLAFLMVLGLLAPLVGR